MANLPPMREGSSRKLDPPSLLRQALSFQSAFVQRLDTTDPWSCSRDELLELLPAAPVGFVASFLYAIYECRTRYEMTLADGDGHVATTEQMALLAGLSGKLQDELECKATTGFMFDVESTDLLVCEPARLSELLAAAPRAWRGYLVGVMQWRVMAEAIALA